MGRKGRVMKVKILLPFPFWSKLSLSSRRWFKRIRTPDLTKLQDKIKQQVRKLPSLWKQCHPLYVNYSCLNLQIKVLTQIKDIHTNQKGRQKLKVIKQVTIGIDSTMVCCQSAIALVSCFWGLWHLFFKRIFWNIEKGVISSGWTTGRDIRVQHPDCSRVSCCPGGGFDIHPFLWETQKMNSRLCTGI